MRQSAGCIASRIAIAALFSLCVVRPAMAEDIDLYTGLQPQAGKPNVLILFDNASTWDASASFTCSTANVVSSNNAGKDVGAEQCALYNAVASIKNSPALLGNLNLGVMMFGTGNNVGGSMRFPSVAPYKLPLMDSTGVDNFLTYVKSIDRQADNSNNSQVGGGMQESWAFYAGRTGLSGTKYTSPIDNPCQRNFVIYIANAVNNGKPQDTGQNVINALVAAGATTAQQQQITIPAPYNGYQSNWGDEWARFMYQTDVQGNMANQQNIVTYTIAVTDGKNPDYVQFTDSMGTNGGGKTYVVQLGDVNGLTSALLQIFNEVQAVNSVFASVSLPASVNAQGQFLNQVYVGMFRPDATAAPRWMGNLKQYQIGYNSKGNIVLQDASGNSAISNAATGFISPGAVSYWTAEPPLTFSTSGYGTGGVANWPAKGFWTNSPSSTGWNLDSPDGEVVEKGGAGEMLRAQLLTSQDSRVLFTCNGAGNCPTNAAMPTFDTANTWLNGANGLAAVNAGTSGAATISSTELPKLIAWMRGADVKAADASSIAGQEAQQGPGSPVTVRGSIHADVLHSRPAVVNYGGSTGVVVFYGTNDGVFHAINGNQAQGIGSVRPGGELWGFIAPEFLGKLSRIYTNSPEVKLSTTPGGITPAPTPRDYFFDGSTTVMQDLRDPAHPRIVLYLTARRGGRLIYALDVTDPANPRYLWKRTNADFPELGQSWSQPRVIRARGSASALIVMGAGYDTTEDSDPAPGTDIMGRGVLVLDALTGSPVWSALPSCAGMGGTCLPVPDLTRAIPSDVTVLDRNGDGYIERFYVGDVGGNIWRADLETTAGNAPANWTLNKLAALGGASGTNAARKFFYPPDVVSTAGYDAVTAGTGDREHPLYSASTTPGTAYNVVNRLYMVKDTNILGMPSTWKPITEAGLVDATTLTGTYDGSGSGFYITLTNPGEKAVNAPLTVSGYTTIGTNTPRVPDANTCYPNLGIARSYSFSFLTSAGQNPARSIILDGGGFPPSSVFGMVSIGSGTSATVVPVLLGGGNQTGPGGGDATSALGAQKVNIAGVGKRKRIYWYPESDKH
ncbi:pilus assembly protein [Cupriavidus basilensis]|uniref:Type IV fimbrial biogenesis protein PilY1 n=1 Tax=Cupriavidus basilensis TaxID=68895 RepID=A0A0C4YD26_9BURK|nr:PilC/PilY family type IV pilus protein [Cupriavidus basilensis]AJG20803.1 Type IV fimbrial biogenesis protein PilY1 [Cupriavidus basilensis]